MGTRSSSSRPGCGRFTDSDPLEFAHKPWRRYYRREAELVETMKPRQSFLWAIQSRVLASAALLFSFGSSPALAQGADSTISPAQSVGTAFLKAIQAGDWKAAAAFLDIVPLDHHRLRYIDMTRRTRRSSGMTVEQLMRSDSMMPRVVAEYQVQRMKIQSQNYNFLEHEFGVGDTDSLAAMPASVVAQHWLEAHDSRWAMRQAMKRNNCPSISIDSLPRPAIRILGTVVNGPTAYMLYERDDDAPSDLNDVQSVGPRMLVLRRDIDAWWVVPRVDRNGVLMSMSCATGPAKK